MTKYPTLGRSTAFYLRRALTHPAHVLVVLTIPFAFFFAWSFVVFGSFLLGDSVAVLAVAQLPSFRRVVDAAERAVEVSAAVKSRVQLLERITEAHRGELQRLEGLADAIRERLMPDAPDVEDCLGTGRLLATYVGGAMAYRAALACLSTTDCQKVAADVATLTEATTNGRTEALRRVAKQRLCIARMRAARWDATFAELEIMQQQLALIGNLVRLMYENAAAPGPSLVLAEEVDHALASVGDGVRTVRELADLLQADDTPEPRVLETGRRALAALAERASNLGANPATASAT